MTVLDAKLIFEKTLNLDPKKLQPKKFVIVGAGGNGGYLIPNLLRQIRIQNKELELAGKTNHEVFIIDGDEV